MILILMIISVLIFLWINYYISSRDIFNPCVIFCAIHAISLITCAIFGYDYGVSLHVDTWIAVMLGLFSFTFVNFFFLLLSNKRHRMLPQIATKLKYIKVDSRLLIVIIAVQLIIFANSLSYVIGVARTYYGGGKSIFEYIGLYRSFNIYHADELATLNISRSTMARFGKVIASILCYPLMAIEVNNVIAGKKLDKLICASIAIDLVFSFLTGTRSEAFRIVTAIVYFAVILRRKHNGQIGRGNIKSIYKVFVLILILGYGFLAIRSFIGRSQASVAKWYYSIIPYLGGPFMNLDNALQSTLPSSNIWGQYTFTDIINEFFIGILDISSYSMADINTFNAFNGINTGNVYTTYYPFVIDFGFIGIIPLISILAIFYCWTYSKDMDLYTDKLPFGSRFFFAGYMFNSLIMVIFSNRFYENVLSMYTIVLVIGMTFFWKTLSRRFVTIE